MRNINRKSIATKLSSAMMIIIFVQTALIFCGILISGSMTDLRIDTYGLLEQKVENRKILLENKVNGRFSEINAEKCAELLANEAMDGDSTIEYMIAEHDKETGALTPLRLECSGQSKYVDTSTALDLEQEYGTKNIYRLRNAVQDVSVICSVMPLELYGENKGTDETQLVLVGLVEPPGVVYFAKLSIVIFAVIMLCSTTICVFISCFTGKKVTKNIVQLAKTVRKNDPMTAVSLGRTNILEIDELASAMEELNARVLDGMHKTEKIFDMVDLQLGTFEHRKGNHSIQCSGKVLELLDLNQESNQMIDSEVFFKRMDSIREHVEDEQNHIYMVKGSPNQWLKIVFIDNADAVLGVVMDVTSAVLDNHAIKFELEYDRLTSLYNRYAFYRNVEQIMFNQMAGVAACVMYDLDNLKFINDTYGHDIGDCYIKEAAQILSSHMKEKGIAARMSGDEFYVFLYDFTTKDEVRKLIDTVYDAFDAHQFMLPNGEEIKIRISGGVAWYGEDSYYLSELIQFADFAMYQVKRTIKGEVREFDRALYEKESFMLSGREELNQILDNQLIDYVLQPIVSAKTGENYGYEALMRPRSQILSSPDKLLQIARAQSQLCKVERITLVKVLALYKEHIAQFKDSKIFINSIASECLSQSELDEIDLQYAGMMDNVVIEITEEEKSDETSLRRKHEIIKRWGGQIALDDYGSGYNGDVLLISIAPQIVKMDILMIQGIEHNRNRQSILQKLILYAKEQNILVLAEGVETREQLAYLVGAGVDLLQGYYISRPILLPDFF